MKENVKRKVYEVEQKFKEMIENFPYWVKKDQHIVPKN